MISLKDYIGSIVSDLNHARAMADIQSANIAKIYAQDELLSNFSIPRFKAREIKLKIPVAIDKLNEKQPVDYQPIQNKEFNSSTYHALKDISKQTSFTRNISLQLKKTISMNTGILEKEIKSGELKDASLKLFSKKVSETFMSIYGIQKGKKEEIKKLLFISKGESLSKKIEKMLIEKLNPIIKEKKDIAVIESTQVIVEASKLNEIKPENVIQIEMTLNEEGMEWNTHENSEGKIISKLLAE